MIPIALAAVTVLCLGSLAFSIGSFVVLNGMVEQVDRADNDSDRAMREVGELREEIRQISLDQYPQTVPQEKIVDVVLQKIVETEGSGRHRAAS